MMLRYSGIDPEKEMKILALGAERARFSALKEGIVDVIVFLRRRIQKAAPWDFGFWPELTSSSNFLLSDLA